MAPPLHGNSDASGPLANTSMANSSAGNGGMGNIGNAASGQSASTPQGMPSQGGPFWNTVLTSEHESEAQEGTMQQSQQPQQSQPPPPHSQPQSQQSQLMQQQSLALEQQHQLLQQQQQQQPQQPQQPQQQQQQQQQHQQQQQQQQQNSNEMPLYHQTMVGPNFQADVQITYLPPPLPPLQMAAYPSIEGAAFQEQAQMQQPHAQYQQQLEQFLEAHPEVGSPTVWNEFSQFILSTINGTTTYSELFSHLWTFQPAVDGDGVAGIPPPDVVGLGAGPHNGTPAGGPSPWASTFDGEDATLNVNGPPPPVGVLPPGTFAALQYNNLLPTNDSLRVFLRRWLGSPRIDPSMRPTSVQAVDAQLDSPVTDITYEMLSGDLCDFQGIDWTAMGVTRQDARWHRKKSFQNYVSVRKSDAWTPTRLETLLPSSEVFYRFRRMHIQRCIHLPHFQLRNLLACTSRSHAFYADRQGIVRHFNTLTGQSSTAFKFTRNTNVQISTIAAGHDVLIAGGFNGEYCVARTDPLYLDEKPFEVCAEGTVTNTQSSGISNHIEVHNLRNVGGPLAAFASNDLGLRIVDLTTQALLSEVLFNFPLNCTAISPDRRLRVAVGDRPEVLIVAADPQRSTRDARGVSRAEIVQTLEGHRDFGFACAWADDGYTVATGNQDRAIKIWDARKFSSGAATRQGMPVHTLRTEMAGVRSLRFSPAGSGRRVLVAAEEADVVSVIDAQTFRTSQTLDVFGELAGIAFGGQDGSELLALCADQARGGLVHFERDRVSAAAAASVADETSSRWVQSGRRGRSSGSLLDWPVNTVVGAGLGLGEVPTKALVRRQRQRMTRRRLRAVTMHGVEPF